MSINSAPRAEAVLDPPIQQPSFQIDPEFKKLIPPLSAEERAQLESNIIEDGCRDPLTVWLEEGLLLDGHNRTEICAECGVQYEVVYVSLPSRQDAINWIINNQLGRRNLNPTQASDLRGRRYNTGKLDRAQNLVQNSPNGKNYHSDREGTTAQKLASEYGVSEKTIRNDGKFAEAVDVIDEALGEEAYNLARSGKITKQDVVDAAAWFEENSGIAEVFEPVDDYEEEAPVVEEVVQPFVPATEKEILAAAKKIREKKTEKRREERKAKNAAMCAEPPPLTDLPSRFDLIYADPPWQYDFNQTDSRVVENHYPTMQLKDICKLPVADITIPNAVLFLWATFPKLEEALQVVNAWGFKYRTAIVWDKVKMGQGTYTRQQTELLLIAIKGEMYSPERDYAGNFRSLVSIERSQNHSEKPKEFYGIIEGLYPDCTRVELFARNQRDGWHAWGNQA
jgi:N6-adenosine-specific RNA methylase IME4